MIQKLFEFVMEADPKLPVELTTEVRAPLIGVLYLKQRDDIEKERSFIKRYTTDVTLRNNALISWRHRHLMIGDPDPFGLHRVPLDVRLACIENWLLNGDPNDDTRYPALNLEEASAYDAGVLDDDTALTIDLLETKGH